LKPSEHHLLHRTNSEEFTNQVENLKDMHSQEDIERIASELLSTKGLKLVSCKTLQLLWAGYGHICQIKALPFNSASSSKQELTPLILKYISPPAIDSKRLQKEGHLRKILSYQIEQYFYSHLAPQLPRSIAVASCLVSVSGRSDTVATAMIMSDLRSAFPIAGEQRAELNETQVYAALDWLAEFHGFWWDKARLFDRSKLCRPPLEHLEHTKSTTANEGVWLNGGYTYLATRRDEYHDLSTSDSEWSGLLCTPLVHLENQPTVAELAARFLAPSANGSLDGPISEYETVMHGDVKSENLFTTAGGNAVAFFDFQYVGLGLGVCDLAKLFTCSLAEQLLSAEAIGNDESDWKMGGGEKELLRYYLNTIEQVSGRQYKWDLFVRHWETALVDWLRFQASWGFWGNTRWLESRVRSILKNEEWKEWLLQEMSDTQA
jgi:hypothetical protein